MYYFLGRAKGEEVGRQEIVDEVLELIREKVKDNTDCSELFKIIKR